MKTSISIEFQTNCLSVFFLLLLSSGEQRHKWSGISFEPAIATALYVMDELGRKTYSTQTQLKNQIHND